MNRDLATRLAVLALSATGLSGCSGLEIENDGRMFQRWADQVAAIPVTPEEAAADRQAQERARLQVEVVDPLELPTARDAGLRTASLEEAAAPIVRAALETAVETAVQETTARVIREAAPVPTAAPAPVVQKASVRASAPGDAHAAQIGSFRTPEDARRAWAELRRDNAAALAGLRPRIETVDLGERGSWVRLKAGPVADRAEAERVCAQAGVTDRWCAKARFTGAAL